MHRIAIIPGDGVGPEVVRESRKLLDFIDSRDKTVELAFDEFPWGTDYYLDTGEMMPADGLAQLSRYDAILFGAVGSPRVPDQNHLSSTIHLMSPGRLA